MAGHKDKEARKGQGIGLKLIAGILLLVLGVWLMWIWKEAVFALLKGAVSIMALVFALIILAMAKE